MFGEQASEAAPSRAAGSDWGKNVNLKKAPKILAKWVSR
jgi:hypothetical protein